MSSPIYASLYRALAEKNMIQILHLVKVVSNMAGVRNKRLCLKEETWSKRVLIIIT